jgi:hypothetical protein
MPEKHIYEYAVVRIVPKVEREEFINVGVILFSKQAAFIRMVMKLIRRGWRPYHRNLISILSGNIWRLSVKCVQAVRREESLLNWKFRNVFVG